MEFRDRSTTSRQYGFRVTEMSVAKFDRVRAEAASNKDATSKVDSVFRGCFSLPAPNNARGLAWFVKYGPAFLQCDVAMTSMEDVCTTTN